MILSGRTHPTLDVLLESRIDDYWNVDGDRMLPVPWTAFTQFTISNDKTSRWLLVVRREIDESSSPILHDQKFGQRCRKVLNKKIEGNWAIEKRQIDNARQLTGIYYMDLDDMEFKDTMKNARKKVGKCRWHPPCLAQLPLSMRRLAAKKDNSRRTRYAFIVEAHDATRTRTGTTQSRDHEDLVAEKGLNSLSHYNLVHKPIDSKQ